MAQVKVYGIRGHLAKVRTKLSETIHDCVVEALRFSRDKRAHRFFHMDPEDCSTRRVGPTPTRSSRSR